MKSLVILFTCTWCCCAQIPTLGLKVQYDGVTVGSGALTDLSGNGNNCTLTGTTQVAQGTTFNGTSDICQYTPVLSGNTDFTMLIIMTGSNNNIVWEEADSANANHARMGPQGNISELVGSGGSAAVPNNFLAHYVNGEYHGYIFQRAGRSLKSGNIESPYSVTLDLGGNPTFTATCATIGAQGFGAGCTSHNVYWAGTMAYFLLYARALSLSEIQAAYTAIQAAVVSRPVFIQDYHASFPVTGTVYQRQGVMIESGQPIEPTIVWDYTANICKMWMSSGSNIAYSTSPDCKSAWATPTTVLNGYGASYVIRVDSTHYKMSALNRSTLVIDTLTSSDGLTWTVLTAGAIPLGSSGAWDSNTVYNSAWLRVDATHSYMIYEAKGPLGIFQCGGATSSDDGASWTKVSANPIIGIGGNCSYPMLWQSPSGHWYMWGGPNISGASGNGMTRWDASSFNSFWTPMPMPQFLGTAPDEAVGSSGQAADVMLMGGPTGNQTYLFYSAVISGVQAIKLAIAQMPMSQLVLTSEGATSSVP